MKSNSRRPQGWARRGFAFSVVVRFILLLLATAFFIVNPGESKVLQLFGE